MNFPARIDISQDQQIFKATLDPTSPTSQQDLVTGLRMLHNEYKEFGLIEASNDAAVITVSSELQLEFLLDTLERKHHVKARAVQLEVIYLEPIVKIEIKVPDPFSSAIVEEFRRRGIAVDLNSQLITAHSNPKRILGLRNAIHSIAGSKSVDYTMTLVYYQQTTEPGLENLVE
jgi:translation elongation factor EF-G